MSYAHNVLPATAKRYHFARLLGEEVARIDPCRPGSWRHMEALEAAWKRAEKRARGGL